MTNLDLEEIPLKKYQEADAGDGTRREDQYLEGIHLALCVASVLLIVFLYALDQTIVVTMITEVGNEFDAFDKIGWLISAFFLPTAILAPSWGQISIAFGRKWTMFCSVIIFEAGSLMCALAPNMNTLIGGRVLSGIGGGGIQGMAYILVTEIFKVNRRPLGLVLFGLVFSAASVLGPIIGGAFTSNVTWRWCFYINLPIGGVGLVMFFITFNPPLPDHNVIDQLRTLDFVGSLLIAAGLSIFLMALGLGSENMYEWNSAAVICCFIFGIVFFIGFCVWNFKFSTKQLIPTEVVKSLGVLFNGVCMFGTFASFQGGLLYMSVYFQNVKDRTPINTGLSMLPMLIGASLFSIIAGAFIKKTGFIKPVEVFGTIMPMVGFGLLTLYDVDSSDGAIIGLQIPVGAGLGTLMQSIIMSSQISAPKNPGGLIMTTTFIVFGRCLGGVLGSLLSTVTYNASFRRILNNAVNNLKDPDIISELMQYDISKLAQSTGSISQLSNPSQRFIKVQISKATRNVFYMALGFATVAFISGLFTANNRLPKEKDIEDRRRDGEVNEMEEEMDKETVLDMEKVQSVEKARDMDSIR